MASVTALALQGAGVLASAAGPYAQGKAARAQGNYLGDVAEQNAKLAEQQATDATARGATSESRFRTSTSQLVGAQKTGYAGQGVDVSTGTPAEVMADSARLGELDALTIRNNAAREAFGYTVQAANERTQGAMARMAGENTASSANAQAASTLLTGGAQFGNAWQKNPPSFGSSVKPTSRSGWGGSV